MGAGASTVSHVIARLEACDRETCHDLVHRLLSSGYFKKSSRLTEMLLYLADRTLNDGVTDIHELEVGCRVFGRPAHYDTGADNIVRVHASMLRKRLREYFQTEGIAEPIVIDIPRGNYAPVFRMREDVPEYSVAEPAVVETPALVPEMIEAPSGLSVVHLDAAISTPTPPARVRSEYGFWLPTVVAVILAVLCGWLLLRPAAQTQSPGIFAGAEKGPLRSFWGQVFKQGVQTQIVLDDASVDLYQTLTAHTIPLSEYFDRSYLSTVRQDAEAARLNPEMVGSFILRRESNYADTSILWKLARPALALGSTVDVRFARDLTFSQLKTGNVILLGNRQSNPWIQLFETNLGLRWKVDPKLGVAYPEDVWTDASERDHYRENAGAGKTHEGYVTISFLPNLTGTGSVLVITGTGGTAVSAAVDFLSDEPGIDQIRSRLGVSGKSGLPPFEVLLKIEKSTALPRGTAMITCRALRTTMAPRGSETTARR